MAILPKLACRVNTITIEIPAGFFCLIDKLILKFIKKMQNTRIAKTTSKKKKARGLTLSVLPPGPCLCDPALRLSSDSSQVPSTFHPAAVSIAHF